MEMPITLLRSNICSYLNTVRALRNPHPMCVKCFVIIRVSSSI